MYTVLKVLYVFLKVKADRQAIPIYYSRRDLFRKKICKKEMVHQKFKSCSANRCKEIFWNFVKSVLYL